MSAPESVRGARLVVDGVVRESVGERRVDGDERDDSREDGEDTHGM